MQGGFMRNREKQRELRKKQKKEEAAISFKPDPTAMQAIKNAMNGKSKY